MPGKDLTKTDGIADQGGERIQGTSPPPGMEITPISFRRPDPERRSPPWGRLLGLVLLVFFCVLAGAAWFVFTAKQVVIRIEPEPEGVSVSGGWFAPRMGSYYLMRPGEYILEASKACYQPLREPMQITEEQNQTRSFKMEKLPGRLSIHSTFHITPTRSNRIRIEPSSECTIGELTLLPALFGEWKSL